MLPFRLAKTLLEEVWDALKLLSGVAKMSLGALEPLLGLSKLVLASPCLFWELVLLACLASSYFLFDIGNELGAIGRLHFDRGTS